MKQLEAQLPDDFQETIQLARLSRRLNVAMSTNYYSPDTLRQMTMQQIDHLSLAIELM